MEDTPKIPDLDKQINLDTEQNNDMHESQSKVNRTPGKHKSRKQTYRGKIITMIEQLIIFKPYKDNLRAQKIFELQKSSTLNNNNNVEDKKETLKDKVGKFVNSTPFSIVMSIITIYALFADDVRVIATNKDADPVFWGISCFCLAAFSFEITLSCISQPGYFLGFFFWLDVMSTVSLILDIGWISNAIFQTGSKSSASSVASLAKASRASRVGTRAGRIVRVVRLVRLVRLYKHAQLAFSKQAKKFELEQQKLMEEQRRQNQDSENKSDSIASSQQLQQQIPNDHNSPHLNEQINPNDNVSPKNNQDPIVFPNQNIDPNDQSFKQKEIELEKEKKPRYKTVIQKQIVDHHQRTPNNKSHTYSPPYQPPAPEDIDKKSLKDQVDEDLQSNHRQERRHQTGTRERNSSFQHSVSIGGGASSYGMSQISNDRGGQKVPQQAETKVGKTLSDLTTKRVITIVLLIMFSMPIFTVGTYVESPSSFQYNLQIIYKVKDIQTLHKKIVDNYIDFHTDQRTPLIRLDIDNVEFYPSGKSGVIDFENERNDDLNYFTYTNDNGDVVATSIASSRDNNILDAILSIVRTIFVSFVLTMASVTFTQDVEEYILEPVEKMLQKVKRISSNPLEAAQMEEKEAFAIEQLEEEGNVKELEKIKKTEGYETVVLEKLIIRVGALLALGFGEAGSQIIAKNMSQNGTVDPMLPGNKIMAIFGFCDIRNFTDATEVLQQGVMIFVNEIAQITHSTVDSYLGQANKNIGDAFLLVWKYRDKDYLKNYDGTVEFLKNDLTSNYADLSVLAFLKIMAGITLSNNLKKYKRHKGLQQRMKGYRVKMGFGLHFGWAIEGAIGSDYKIDASYLSPNVNMASRLEAATKQFGTGLLISGPLRDILTPKCQSHMRKIDCVTVKGSIVPLDLYTADVDLERLYEKRKGKDVFDFSNFSAKQLKKKKIVDKMKRNTFKAAVLRGTAKVADQFDTDGDLKEMRKEFTKEFYEIWQKGYQFYHEGKWNEAAKYIKQTLMWFKFRQDGPSQTLYEFMKETSFVAPKDWKGFRALTEK